MTFAAMPARRRHTLLAALASVLLIPLLTPAAGAFPPANKTVLAVSSLVEDPTLDYVSSASATLDPTLDAAAPTISADLSAIDQGGLPPLPDAMAGVAVQLMTAKRASASQSRSIAPTETLEPDPEEEPLTSTSRSTARKTTRRKRTRTTTTTEDPETTRRKVPRTTARAVAPPSPPPPPPPPPSPPVTPSGSYPFSGRATWYNPCDPRQNHGFTCLGTCDNHLDDGSNVVAINVQQYQSWMCEKACVEVLDVEKGIAKRFRVADSCAACGYGGIDFTPASLAQFGRTTVGWEDAEFPIRWKWC